MSPQIECAKAVGEALSGQTIAGRLITVNVGSLLPKYDTPDLNKLRVDVVPGVSATLTRIARGRMSETCPIVVGIQSKCNVSSGEQPYRELLSVLRGVAMFLAGTEIEGFGTPTEDIEFFDEAETVDGEGRFRGAVTTAYTVFP